MEKFLCLHKRAHVSLPDEALEGCLVWQPDSKDSIRVVGFGKAREHDDCRWTEPPHYSLDKYGSWSLFNCKDLYHLSGRIGWLTPGKHLLQQLLRLLLPAAAISRRWNADLTDLSYVSQVLSG